MKAQYINSSISKSFLFAILVALAALFTNSAHADNKTYQLTTRVKPTEAVFDGKTYTQLESTDSIDVTASNAQLWFTAGATLNCNVKISGNGYGSEKTGKIRMDSSASYIFNGTVDFSRSATERQSFSCPGWNGPSRPPLRSCPKTRRCGHKCPRSSSYPSWEPPKTTGRKGRKAALPAP